LSAGWILRERTAWYWNFQPEARSQFTRAKPQDWHPEARKSGEFEKMPANRENFRFPTCKPADSC
jgi:hypothetical protein